MFKVRDLVNHRGTLGIILRIEGDVLVIQQVSHITLKPIKRKWFKAPAKDCTPI